MPAPAPEVVAISVCPDCLTIEALVADQDGALIACVFSPCNAALCECLPSTRQHPSSLCEHVEAARLAAELLAEQVAP
jgi:hypothetical protein